MNSFSLIIQPCLSWLGEDRFHSLKGKIFSLGGGASNKTGVKVLIVHVAGPSLTLGAAYGPLSTVRVTTGHKLTG